MRSIALSGLMAVLCTNVALAAFSPVASGKFSSGTGTQGLSGDTVSFAWSGTPYTGYVEFVASGETAFNLTLSTYTYIGGTSEISAYMLDHFVAGSWQRLTDNTSTFIAGANAFVKANVDNPEDANLIGKINTTSIHNTAANGFVATPTKGNVVPNSGLVFQGLPMGTYRLSLFDSANPVTGQASFTLSSVPEVASLGTWALAGVAGTVWSRRRR